jgi:NADPH:quinone reductase-like Zn-dependent oxidoreductase
MPTNSAAWLDAPYGALVVRPAPYTSPGAGEIVIRNRAVAVNPLDIVKQSTGNLMYGWLPYPSVLGEDVAGEVVEVGAGVTRFAAGDRVFGYAVGMEKKRRHAAEGGFQDYTVLRALLAAPIPTGMTFEEAAVLPLGISTAASALFQKDGLGLRHPTEARVAARVATGAGAGAGVGADSGAGASASAGAGVSASAGVPAPAAVRAEAARELAEVVVVWGGSTSVGSNAIQLAVAAGYTVLTTASPRNHNRMRELGATHVFDYASVTVVPDAIGALAGTRVVGVLAVGTGSAEPSVAIAVGTGAKRVSMASPSVSFLELPRRKGFSLTFVRVMARLVARNIALQVRCVPRGIRARFVWGSSLMNNEVGPMLWEEFLPAALAEGRYVAAPAPHVVGSGLDHVQAALDVLTRGVSAQKVVVSL